VVKPENASLATMLMERRSALIDQWFHQLLRIYPDSSVNFLSQHRDPFRNPVGHTLKQGLATIFDALVQETDLSAVQPALEDIIRIRAVQDISASQAVAFTFHFKRMIRAELAADAARFPEEIAALEARVDEMVLLAFDLYAKCRERISEIRENESRRMAFLTERAHLNETAKPAKRAR
jgi:hypothetical protein